MREYYGYAICAGIGPTEARRLLPGFILDMHKARAEYDIKVSGGKIVRRVMG